MRDLEYGRRMLHKELQVAAVCTHLESTRNLVQNHFLDILALTIGANVSFHIVFEQLLEKDLFLAQLVKVSTTEQQQFEALESSECRVTESTTTV